MKVRKKFAAALLSVLMVLTLLPAGALAMASTAQGTLTINGSSSYSAYPVIKFSGVSNLSGTGYVYTNPTVSSEFKTDDVIKEINSLTGKALTTSSPDNDFASALSTLTDNSAKVAELAETLQAVTTRPTAISLPAKTKTSVPYGYYLVVDNGGHGNIVSRPILVGVPSLSGATPNPDVTVNVKPATANLTKKIQVDANNESNMTPTMLVDSSTTVKDSAVYYRTLSDIPAYASDAAGIVYTVTDTMSQGLTFGAIDSVDIVKPGTNYYDEAHPSDYTTEATLQPNDAASGYKLSGPTATGSNNETKFTITLGGTTDKDKNIIDWGKQGYKLMIRYHVTLQANGANSKVNVGSTGNPNSANLTYSNMPGGGTSTNHTDDDTVITYTNQLIVTKTDASDSSKKISGATFELYRSTGTANGQPVFNSTSDETETTGDGAKGTVLGVASFTKLQQGTYKLVETVAPAGYSTLSDPIIFTVTASNGSDVISNININQNNSGNTPALAFLATWNGSNNIQTSDGKDGYSLGTLKIGVQDTAGFILPGTGGIGTTIFFVSGIAILLLGGCLAFVYTKKKKTGSHFQH